MLTLARLGTSGVGNQGRADRWQGRERLRHHARFDSARWLDEQQELDMGRLSIVRMWLSCACIDKVENVVESQSG